MLNYNMQGMNKTIPEIFAMLKVEEVEIKKEETSSPIVCVLNEELPSVRR